MNEPRILAGLPVFRAVATLGSFSVAANQLGVTPSAVSQAIKALEDQLGTQLIARTSRSMRLTETGARFLADIDKPLARLSQAMQSARDQRDRVEGPLTISLSHLAAAICVHPFLSGFLKAYPAIRLDLTNEERPAEFAKGGCDAAIRLQDGPDGDMISIPVGPPLRRRLLASPDYIARHGAPSQPEDLMAHRLCRFRLPGNHKPEPLRFKREQESLELDPPATIVLDDPGMIGMILRGGQVMAQTLHPADEDATETGDVLELLTDFEPAPMQFQIYYPSRAPKTAQLQAFLDWFTRKPCEQDG